MWCYVRWALCWGSDPYKVQKWVTRAQFKTKKKLITPPLTFITAFTSLQTTKNLATPVLSKCPQLWLHIAWRFPADLEQECLGPSSLPFCPHPHPSTYCLTWSFLTSGKVFKNLFSLLFVSHRRELFHTRANHLFERVLRQVKTERLPSDPSPVFALTLPRCQSILVARWPAFGVTAWHFFSPFLDQQSILKPVVTCWSPEKSSWMQDPIMRPTWSRAGCTAGICHIQADFER